MAKKKYASFKVTFTQEYLIPMINDEISEINGWTMEEIYADWFFNHGADGYHATRDGYRVGNSRKLVKIHDPEIIEGLQDED